MGTPGSAEVTVLDNDASTLTLSAQPQEVAEDAKRDGGHGDGGVGQRANARQRRS